MDDFFFPCINPPYLVIYNQNDYEHQVDMDINL